MDCMCFGMGCSCLQVTFQACNIDEARTLYDQLVPMAPIMVFFSLIICLFIYFFKKNLRFFLFLYFFFFIR